MVGEVQFASTLIEAPGARAQEEEEAILDLENQAQLNKHDI